MTERQVGIEVVGDDVTVVEALVPADRLQPIEIVSDTKWSLQAGERPEAYAVIAKRCSNFIRENDVCRVLVKASGTTRGAATLAHLQSAELRGVIVAAAASSATVKLMAKNAISRNYGDRNFDDYVKDDGFWSAQTTGGRLRKTSRSAAMVMIAARG
jgi:hypothetical protein